MWAKSTFRMTKQKTRLPKKGKRRILPLAGIFIFVTSFSPATLLFAQTPKGATKPPASPVYYSPGGTYSDWYFTKDQTFSSLEWTFVPVQDPPESLAKAGLLHYYAYNFGLDHATSAVGRGYAGFQTNGIFKNKQKGKIINFSIWGSNGGKSPAWVNKSNGESGGYQIMMPYKWVVGHHYRFELKAGPSGQDDKGKWWGLYVTDLDTKKKDFVGEQRVPAIIGGKSSTHWAPHTSMFGEDLHWWQSLNGQVKFTDQSSFQPSAMAAINITANNGRIRPIGFHNHTNSGEPVKADNGFLSVSADVSIYQNDSTFDVQHNLGHWATPAPNMIQPAK